ncbi:hypothetical protein [Aeromicrobium sp. UC242_57]|uniref:hypothetical protein n=1 Tax=Aeromicrobium sp. UC242_57 TaxID=3374624 RepID=UPI00378E4A97
MALPETAGRVMLAVSGVAVLCCLPFSLQAGADRSQARCASASARPMMTVAMIYLKSLDPDGADIPLGGVGGLFLGLVLLVVGLVRLRSRIHRSG